MPAVDQLRRRKSRRRRLVWGRYSSYAGSALDESTGRNQLDSHIRENRLPLDFHYIPLEMNFLPTRYPPVSLQPCRSSNPIHFFILTMSKEFDEATQVRKIKPLTSFPWLITFSLNRKRLRRSSRRSRLMLVSKLLSRTSRLFAGTSTFPFIYV